MSVLLADLIDRAVKSWKQAGIPLLPPANADTIRRAINGFGRQVPEDVLQLYQTVGGFADYDLYDNCWGLWSLDRIVEWNPAYFEWSTAPERKLTGFADVGLDLWFLCFQYENERESSVWIENGENVHLVASSMAEFLSLCLSDPGKVGLLGPNVIPPGSPLRE